MIPAAGDLPRGRGCSSASARPVYLEAGRRTHSDAAVGLDAKPTLEELELVAGKEGPIHLDGVLLAGAYQQRVHGLRRPSSWHRPRAPGLLSFPCLRWPGTRWAPQSWLLSAVAPPHSAVEQVLVCWGWDGEDHTRVHVDANQAARCTVLGQLLFLPALGVDRGEKSTVCLS